LGRRELVFVSGPASAAGRREKQQQQSDDDEGRYPPPAADVVLHRSGVNKAAAKPGHGSSGSDRSDSIL
jgi:hypothetical protein